MSVEENLKTNRPNLSNSSVKTYNSTLRNIYKKVYPNDEIIDIDKFNNHKLFLDYLKNVDYNKRKSILSALVVIAKDNEKYREQMLQDATKYNKEQEENKKNEKQELNWINQDEVKKIFYIYQDEANKIFKIKGDLTMPQLQTIQNYIIICLTAGLFIPPRRSLDWVLMKHKNYNTDTDNYYNKKKFVFNQYKTAKYYNKQDIEVPATLKLIINRWLKYVNNDYILFDSNNNPLTPVKLNQRLNKIFDGKISVNALRHSFITEKYNNLPKLKEIKDEAMQMGHSLEEHLQYIKK